MVTPVFLREDVAQEQELGNSTPGEGCKEKVEGFKYRAVSKSSCSAQGIPNLF